MNTKTKADEVFRQEFPALARKHALKEFQRNVINHYLEQGSTLAIMPTGGGKSWIYWVAARGMGGTCLVVSPLIALIDEQAAKLREQGQEVLVIHSGIEAGEQRESLKRFARGEDSPSFLFASPERLATDGFFSYCLSQRREDIKSVVIDEVHCICQWGDDFRPFYKHIPLFLDEVFEPWPPVLGLTATINPKELGEISEDFHIGTGSIIKDNILLRRDIDIKIERVEDKPHQERRLWELIDEHRDRKILVYHYSKHAGSGVDALMREAKERAYEARSFHGDMSAPERQKIIQAFKSGKSSIVFATNAFGMGIDIPDIQVVIHYSLPVSIEQYYQEIGRAGRDRNGAKAYLLYSERNIEVKRSYFIDGKYDHMLEKAESVFQAITHGKKGIQSYQYYSEENSQYLLPYFLKCNALSIQGKGFAVLKNLFSEVRDEQVSGMMAASRTGLMVPLMKKEPYAGRSCREFFGIVYRAMVEDRVTVNKSPTNCLIIEAGMESVEGNEMLRQEVTANRAYRNELFDHFVNLIRNYENSKLIHQEIGKYLGVDKHQLNKEYLTENDTWVRSKSEVIIANILYRSGLEFEYEKKLPYGRSGKWKEPDFTISQDGEEWYWEHLGLLGDEKYNANWQEKRRVYDELGVLDRVIVTDESAILSKDVNRLIKQHFKTVEVEEH